uniref:Uncharacterized protein n=1 Tax=Trichogramma kaykai TaxID=54128 RepID=A0ABD2WK07_9HYME
MKLLGRAVGKEKRHRKLEEQRRRQQQNDKKHIEYIPIAHCSKIPGFNRTHLHKQSTKFDGAMFRACTYSNRRPAHTHAHTHTYSHIVHSSTSNSRRIISSAISSATVAHMLCGATAPIKSKKTFVLFIHRYAQILLSACVSIEIWITRVGLSKAVCIHTRTNTNSRMPQ